MAAKNNRHDRSEGAQHDMTDDIRAAVARRAAEAHERLIQRAEAKRGKEGVVALSERGKLALHERMRAELEARNA